MSFGCGIWVIPSSDPTEPVYDVRTDSGVGHVQTHLGLRKSLSVPVSAFPALSKGMHHLGRAKDRMQGFVRAGQALLAATALSSFLIIASQHDFCECLVGSN